MSRGRRTCAAAFPTGCAICISPRPARLPSWTAISVIGSLTPRVTRSSTPIKQCGKKCATPRARCSSRDRQTERADDGRRRGLETAAAEMSGQSPRQSPRSEQVLDADRQVADAREDVRVGAERGQGVGEIAGMVGDAMLVDPEHGEAAVEAVERGAARAGLALVAGFPAGIAEIVAAVRCSTLPPGVVMLRNYGLAAIHSASDSMG